MNRDIAAIAQELRALGSAFAETGNVFLVGKLTSMACRLERAGKAPSRQAAVEPHHCPDCGAPLIVNTVDPRRPFLYCAMAHCDWTGQAGDADASGPAPGGVA